MSESNFPIETRVVTLINSKNSIFSKSKKYSIPAYQRDYSWGEKEVETLLDNILDGCNSDTPLFVGTIQFSKDSKTSDERFDIVDGQQRLTTIILLLKLIELYTKEDILRQNNMSVLVNKSDELNKQFNYVLEFDNLEEVEELDKSKKGKEAFNAETNVYYKNIRLMRNYIECIDEYKGLIKRKKENTFVEKLKEYILKKLYFVELTTNGLSIPETVKIFNTINTTGLDLNSSDIFKLQYYQYLKDSGNSEDNWLEKINSCYEKIEKFKFENTSSVYVDSKFSMSQILDVYKHILSAEYNLKWENLSKSNENFFEWIFKKENSQDKEALLNFDKFEAIVDNYLDIFRYTFIDKKTNFNRCAQKFIEITRYSRYWTLPYVITFFKAGKSRAKISDIDYALELSLTISKYFVVNSVLYDKVVNPVQTFMCNEILPRISQIQEEDKIVELIQKKIWISPYDSNEKINDRFKERLEKNLFDNGSRCHLICTLSAIIDEVNAGKESKIRELFFNWKYNPYDNEHIFPKNRFSELSDQEFVNGIGNLVTLEAHINRSVKDDITKKVEQYPNSKFTSVKEIISQCSSMEWSVEHIEKRKEAKMEKIKNWLDGKQ